MSDLFDKLAESAGHVISEVDKGGQIQGAISGLRMRLAEADRRRKLNAVKQQLRDLQTQESQAINALSAQVMALHEAGTLTQPELVSLCKRVDDIRVQIKEQEDELAKLQPPPAVAPGPPTPTASARCPQCGAAVVAGATFCQSCGNRLVAEQAPSPAPVQFCIHCGQQLREGARFCPTCGQSVAQPG